MPTSHITILLEISSLKVLTKHISVASVHFIHATITIKMLPKINPLSFICISREKLKRERKEREERREREREREAKLCNV